MYIVIVDKVWSNIKDTSLRIVFAISVVRVYLLIAYKTPRHQERKHGFLLKLSKPI